MEVIAPANLQEGYEFEAQVGSQSFTVAVPLGGVEMGQKFLVPFQAQNVRPTTNVPVGAWKDSILDCCSYGPCHNHFCISSWCVPRKCTLQCIFPIRWHSFILTDLCVWNVSRTQQSPLVKSFQDSSWHGMRNQDRLLKPPVHFSILPSRALFTGPFTSCPTFLLVLLFMMMMNQYPQRCVSFW